MSGETGRDDHQPRPHAGLLQRRAQVKRTEASAHAVLLLHRDRTVLGAVRGEKHHDQILGGVDDLADAAQGGLDVVGRGGRIGALTGALSGRENDGAVRRIETPAQDGCGLLRLAFENRIIPETDSEDVGIRHPCPLGRETGQGGGHLVDLVGRLRGRHRHFDRAESAVQRVALGVSRRRQPGQE